MTASDPNIISVGHADVVSSATSVEHADHLVLKPAPASEDRKLFRVLAMVAIVLGLFCIAMSLTIAVYTVRRGNQQQDASGQQIAALNARLETLQHTIDSRNATQQSKDDCLATFGRVTAATRAAADGALDELVIALVDTSVPADQRQAAFPMRVDVLRAAQSAYALANANSKKWADAGEPLPCPITGGTP